MGGIRLISISTVVANAYNAADQNSTGKKLKIHLTPWDLQLLLVDPIQKGLLFQKPIKASPQEIENLIQNLKTSLSHTLNFFPQLSGRISVKEHDDKTTSFSIDCNNAGAQFVHAKVDGLSVSDIIEPIYVPQILHSFFLFNGVKNYQGVSNPLLGVQITELADGIFLGCTINHAVVDGTSFWHFFNSWAEISRGFDTISKPPIHNRWLPDNTHFPIRIPFSETKQQVANYKVSNTNTPTKERVFHFSKEKVQQLKSKANYEIGANNISSLQAVLAHLWRSVIRCENTNDSNKDTSYCLLIGARARLSPQLTEQYFGNAVQAGSVTVKARDLVEKGLGYAAWEMNKMVALHKEEQLKSFLISWIEKPKLITEENIASNALVTSSSPRFDVYGNDFGWGNPIAVRSGVANKTYGKITVFSGIEKGSIDIETCLPFQTLEAMSNDSEFIKAVGA